MSDNWVTPDALLNEIRRRVRLAGSQQALAKRLRVSGAYLSDVLNGRREAGGKLLKALGYRRVVIYQEVRP